MNESQLLALQSVVEYLFEDEQSDYEANDMEANHIFNSLVELQAYLDNHKHE